MKAQTVNMQLSKMNMQLSNMEVEGNAKFEAMEERHLALENHSRTPARSSDPKVSQKTEEIQRTTRAVAAGFHEDAWEQ